MMRPLLICAVLIGTWGQTVAAREKQTTTANAACTFQDGKEMSVRYNPAPSHGWRTEIEQANFSSWGRLEPSYASSSGTATSRSPSGKGKMGKKVKIQGEKKGDDTMFLHDVIFAYAG